MAGKEIYLCAPSGITYYESTAHSSMPSLGLWHGIFRRRNKRRRRALGAKEMPWGWSRSQEFTSPQQQQRGWKDNICALWCYYFRRKIQRAMTQVVEERNFSAALLGEHIKIVGILDVVSVALGFILIALHINMSQRAARKIRNNSKEMKLGGLGVQLMPWYNVQLKELDGNISSRGMQLWVPKYHRHLFRMKLISRFLFCFSWKQGRSPTGDTTASTVEEANCPSSAGELAARRTRPGQFLLHFGVLLLLLLLLSRANCGNENERWVCVASCHVASRRTAN